MATSTVPTPPDEATANKDDWLEFKDLYEGWVARATDDELLAEMAALPVNGRPLSPSEAWRYHQCELRRRSPRSQRSTPAASKKG